MARNFSLSAQAAREANSGGKRITETGKYKGKITASWYEKNEKGTESVCFKFESDAGQEAGPLIIYTHKSTGEELPGYSLLNALLMCAKVKTLTAKLGNVELYDYETQSVVTKQKDTYPELIGARIGLVLQQEQYTKGNGDDGYRMLIFAPFEADTELMAAEIIDRKVEPKLLGGVMSWISKNPTKMAKHKQLPSASHRAAGDFQAPPADAFFDDDLPF